jgi:RimJ/RimL family protein N-acetyltransferase
VGDPESGDLIGSVALAPHEHKPSNVKLRPEGRALERGEKRIVDLGYWLHPEWRGKGIMQAGVKTVIAWVRLCPLPPQYGIEEIEFCFHRRESTKT